MAYKKYDSDIKKMIIDSRNPNLFPELRIPRTTALYWINHSKEAHLSKMKLTGKEEYLNLKKELYRLKAERELLIRLLQKVMEGTNLDGLLFKNKKEFIVKLIDEMRGVLPTTNAIKLIGIGIAQYYRWRIEVYGCEVTNKICESGRPNQLSKLEQEKLIQLATTKRFAHMSVKSLMYYAQREGILYCGYDSWLRYIKINRVVRPQKREKVRKFYRKGIRAKRPFELWHIDITEVVIENNTKFYIQMIVDNYSRCIMSWSLSSRKNLEISLKTIKKSIRNQKEIPSFIMCDGGRENINDKVVKLLLGRGIAQMVAQTDIKFSNSMIEAVFRKMKSCIPFNKIGSESALKNRITWFVTQYNNITPHSSLKGACPKEKLTGTFNDFQFAQEVTLKRMEILKDRSKNNQQCRRCLSQ